jgi:hypothetical protein
MPNAPPRKKTSGLMNNEQGLPMIAGLVVTLPGLFVLFGSRRWFGARAVARERDFIAGLAFGVHGYEEVLARTPSNGTLTLNITFAARTPEHTDMVLGGLLKAEVLGVGNKQFAVKSPDLSVDQGDGPDSNHVFHQWLRRAFKELLVPLHREYQLKSVKLTRN